MIVGDLRSVRPAPCSTRSFRVTYWHNDLMFHQSVPMGRCFKTKGNKLTSGVKILMVPISQHFWECALSRMIAGHFQSANSTFIETAKAIFLHLFYRPSLAEISTLIHNMRTDCSIRLTLSPTNTHISVILFVCW